MSNHIRKGGRITIDDVALAAGVSRSTVSKALNGTGRINADTRQRIADIAEQLGFRPNAVARSLSSQRSFTIGLLTNDTYGRFTLPVMAGVTEALADKQVSVFLCAIDDDDAEFGRTHIHAMLDKQVDGIIAAGRRLDRKMPVDLSGLNIPVVYIMTTGEPGSITFAADDFQGALLATEHLKGLGRERLLHITGPDKFVAAQARAEAFRSLVGMDAEVMFGNWSESWGYEAAHEVWSRPQSKPDAIFCGNDLIARGVLDALRELHVRVPQDVSVVGFDNWEIMAANTRPSLTTIDMNLKELGRQAGMTIVALTNGEKLEPRLEKLPCTLMVRLSCGTSEQN